jgi:hypothetical protein
MNVLGLGSLRGCPRKGITHFSIDTLLITAINGLEPAMSFCCKKIESGSDVEFETYETVPEALKSFAADKEPT